MSFKRIDENDNIQPDEKKSLLIYGYNESEIEEIKNYGDSYNIDDYIIVDSNKTGLTIGELIDKVDTNKEFKGLSSRKTIILSGFSNKDINSFINDFKSCGLKKPIFAIVTPTSLKWEFGRLVKELILENIMMSKNQKSKH